MANVGVSPTSPSESSDIISHTSTHQWQSFEFRMRHRRAERCLLRAEMALDAGLDDEAREALDEAERLHSENPKLGVLRGVLAERTAASAAAYESAQQVASRGRALRVFAAALIFLIVGVTSYLLTRSNAPAVEAGQRAVPNVASQSNDSAPAPSAPPAPPVASGVLETNPTGPTATAGVTDPRQAQSAIDASNRLPGNESAAGPRAPATNTPALPAFNPQFSDPRPVTLPPPQTAVESVSLRPPDSPVPPEPAPAIPETPVAASTGTLDRMGEKLPASNLPAAERRADAEKPVATDKPSSTESTATPAVPTVNEEPRVRAVLARYEAAYSALNASAAQEVWPAVDQRSLARAFETLHSQQVSLGQCSVQVQGATASATCDGSIRWTPKVGGGSQSAARQWRFQLHNGNGAWQITRAEVR